LSKDLDWTDIVHKQKGELMRKIDADALIDKYGDWYTEEGTEEGYIGTIKGIVDSMPTIEPERKKGKWIKGVGENGITTSEFCSCCRYENKHWCDWNFCPNCGADMREGRKKYDS
jgi:hypothetical protein